MNHQALTEAVRNIPKCFSFLPEIILAKKTAKSVRKKEYILNFENADGCVEKYIRLKKSAVDTPLSKKLICEISKKVPNLKCFRFSLFYYVVIYSLFRKVDRPLDSLGGRCQMVMLEVVLELVALIAQKGQQQKEVLAS